MCFLEARSHWATSSRTLPFCYNDMEPSSMTIAMKACDFICPHWKIKGWKDDLEHPFFRHWPRALKIRSERKRIAQSDCSQGHCNQSGSCHRRYLASVDSSTLFDPFLNTIYLHGHSKPERRPLHHQSSRMSSHPTSSAYDKCNTLHRQYSGE